jgi:hypothetical protein
MYACLLSKFSSLYSLAQLSASFHKAGQSSIMKVFVLFTSDTFPGFNVFFKGILYINLSTIHPMVKTVGFLVEFYVRVAPVSTRAFRDTPFSVLGLLIAMSAHTWPITNHQAFLAEGFALAF